MMTTTNYDDNGSLISGTFTVEVRRGWWLIGADGFADPIAAQDLRDGADSIEGWGACVTTDGFATGWRVPASWGAEDSPGSAVDFALVTSGASGVDDEV
jgi:hypothetical protein